MFLGRHFPDAARPLISVRRDDLLATLGTSVVHQIVSDVLMGANVRDATEPLTRRRISLLNGALLATYGNLLKTGIRAEDIHTLAHEELTSGSVSDNDRIVLQWMLGTTKKQIQNVLRSDDDAWLTYLRTLESGLRESSAMSRKMYGDLELRVHDEEVSWDWALSMLMAIGAQTLATRGAEKFLVWKALREACPVFRTVHTRLPVLDGGADFEPFVLAVVTGRQTRERCDGDLESRSGRAFRHRIHRCGKSGDHTRQGFPFRENRGVEMGGTDYFLHTFIIVDRIGKGSRVRELAEQIGGTIIQMSANDWVKTLGEQLAQTLEDYPVAADRSGSRKLRDRHSRRSAAGAPGLVDRIRFRIGVTTRAGGGDFRRFRRGARRDRARPVSGQPEVPGGAVLAGDEADRPESAVEVGEEDHSLVGAAVPRRTGRSG